MTEDLRYPVGPFSKPVSLSPGERRADIAEIATTPAKLRAAVAGLTEAQLDTAYRPGGWTVRQVVHHVPDSHLNAYVRFKLALTEDHPTIRPYDQDLWARLPDSSGPIDVSLSLLDAVHRRWVVVLNAIADTGWSRTFYHPESGDLRLDQVLAMYAWHGRHHVAHIMSLRRRNGW